jgi:hypothetical protein
VIPTPTSEPTICHEVRARRCSHPHCRTTLDEYPVECPHGLPFCEHCTWEEVCSECAP